MACYRVNFTFLLHLYDYFGNWQPVKYCFGSLNCIPACVIFPVKWCTHVSSLVKSLIFSVMGFLNACQDGMNAFLCSVIVLKNNGTSVELVGCI